MHPAPPPADVSRVPNVQEPPEVIVAATHRVWCDGGGGALGHPRVYMEMGQADFVECGYCDRRFVLAGRQARLAEDERADPGAYDPDDTPMA